uniref:NADH dehydrogenase subunit 6 n=1 Tax=Pseudodendrothrips mori TaxID=1291231 RepID=A0A7M3T299_9NEOP|nr:NADH dehydrogenase subunit 6 [Pseudodendrothrips mori]QFO91093.1 NADH dehydrogenase subunit 6 [Pseudodendrothrips mori]
MHSYFKYLHFKFKKKFMYKAFLTLFYLSMFILYLMMFMFFHPLILGLSIILQSILISTTLNFFFLLSWFSYLIFIVYLGGILMIFSYMISLTSFTKIKTKGMILGTFMGLFMFLFFPTSKTSFLITFLEKEKSIINFSLMSDSFFLLSALLMLFLLFIMIVVVFLTESSEGFMRSN